MDAAASDVRYVEVGGHRVRVTSPDKVLYPGTGTTKWDVVEYVREVAEVLLRHAGQRAVTRKRWPGGVGTLEHPGESFFTKNLERGAPDWVATVVIEHADHPVTYPVLSEEATLVWFAQLAALELHVPQWRVESSPTSPDSGEHYPDRLVLDLDPGEGADLADCAVVALHLRTRLADLGLDTHPLTSGSKGMHLYAPLDGTRTSTQAKDLAHALASELEASEPERVVSGLSKAKRAGKVLIDWSQNAAAKTTVSPYSLRGRVRPTVAAPRTWEEIEAADQGGLTQLTYPDVLRRLDRDGDLLAPLAGT